MESKNKSNSARERVVTFSHRVEYVAWKTVAVGLRFLPRKGSIILADCLGWLAYHIFRLRRKTIDEQLKIAFGSSKTERELRGIGCKSLQYTTITFFEFVQPNLLGEKADVFSAEEGVDEYFRPFIKNPGYALAVSGHIGNWEAMGTLARQEGFQLVAVAKAMHNPLVNKVVVESRNQMGVEVLQVKKSMKGIVDALRKKKWVAFIGDQDARRRGIFVDFFGKPASTATGVAYFSVKMGIPIVPIFCVRMPDSLRSLKLIVLEPIYPVKVDKEFEEEEISRITELHTKALEKIITDYPENYFWLHQRWKTKPKVKKSS